jgi:hypothetical protein
MAKRTVCTAYFNHRHQRMKLPHSNLSVNPNGACMRAYFNMTANTYGATYCEVYDIETAELFAQYRLTREKGELVVKCIVKYEPTAFGNPIRRTSLHAFFHELELETAV